MPSLVERIEKFTGWFYRLPTSLFIRIPAVLPLCILAFSVTVYSMAKDFLVWLVGRLKERH